MTIATRRLPQITSLKLQTEREGIFLKQSFSLVREEGLTIRGDIFIKDDTQEYSRKPVVIVCHGFKGFKDWGMFPRIGEYLAGQGFVAITFNFSGNGIGEDLENFTELERFGRNTYQQELGDLDFLVQQIKRNGLPLAERMDPYRIGMMGHSKGGGDTLLYASSYPEILRAAVTWNGIAHVDIFGGDVRKQAEEEGTGYVINGRTGQKMPIEKIVFDDMDVNARQYDLLNCVAQMDVPLLIVQGREDFARLVKGAESLKEHAKQAVLYWVDGAGHTFNMVHPHKEDTAEFLEALDVTAKFFKEHL
ncbi:Alpha/beta hydrolase family protein [Aneurinibacillus migulanus]|uniref:Alpha/beta hydrolase family protein n=1 Tax=Aneurinibacillus migulanus TaxID=47500 RepID=A0A1G8RCZ7_ANEMI|nr:Alpha/beta hydrolase family protein [Aneurinibacillus migulanus]